jgi:hypothetical protein
MFILYADEFGHDGIWDPTDPQHCHHPLFGLAGVAVPGDRCRDFDRGYLRLKESYYKFEIARAAVVKGIRPERFEWKELRNRRDRRFAADVLRLVERVGGHVFAYGQVKPVGMAAHKSDALYGRTAQGLLDAFEKYLRHRAGLQAGRGVIALDRRDEIRNARVLASAQSYLFSAGPGRFERIVETPLLVPSEWYHGVQAADTIARTVGAVFRFRATGEAGYKRTATELGPLLDARAYTLDDWRSIFVRGMPSPSAPPSCG